MAHGSTHTLDEKTQLRAGPLWIIAVLIGIAGLGISFVSAKGSDGGVQRFYFAYLFGVSMFTAISCSATIFVVIQHLVRSGWVTNIRRILETLATQIVLMAVLFLPVIFVTFNAGDKPAIYSWAIAHPVVHEEHEGPQPASHGGEDKGHVASEANHGEGHASVVPPQGEPYPNHQVRPGVEREYDHLIAKKAGWLNPGFWSFRVLAYLAIISLIALYYRSMSIKQDATGDIDISNKLQHRAPPLLIMLALSVTFLAFDVFMSLDPHWFSTMFGVYFFASGSQMMWSTVALFVLGLQARGYLLQSVTKEHQQDIGKWMFCFVVFFAYIAFSQYMLQWYANLPEETFWFDKRGYSTAHPNGYSPLVITLLIGRFCVPFLGLVSRHVKRIKIGLGFWAVWLLLMGAVDMYLLVIPESKFAFTFSDTPHGLPEIGALIGVAGLFFGNTLRMLSSAAVRPVGDPRVAESLGFTNI